MPGGQRHDRRLQPRPERGRINLLGQPGARPGQTAATAQLMRAVLDRDHADRRQLADLVATEPSLRAALAVGELATAPATRIRVVIDDLIHLILRLQPTPGTPMPRLSTSLTFAALPAHQLLRFLARLRPPLRPRFRRIHRRRLGTRARVLPRLLLKPLQSIVVLLNPGRQLKNELNTCLTPRVINRLRLGALHTCKIRCTNKESLPKTPTTERLHKPVH